MVFKRIICALAAALFIMPASLGEVSARADNFTEVGMFPFAEPDAFKGLTDAQIKALEDRIKPALNAVEPSVDISDFNIPAQYRDSVFNVLFRLSEEYPGYFYVDGQVSSSAAGDKLMELKLFYIYTKDEVIKKTAAIYEETAKIMSMMYASGVKTDFDKAVWIHDYIALNTEYDGTLSKHRIDNVFLEKTVVCQGYASAYKYLLNIAGVECVNVYNNAAKHEWSRVKLDGKWYNVDMTFDDPTYDFINDRLGYVPHTYFLLTDEEIRRYEKHDSAYCAYDTPCTDTKYSGAAFHSAETPVAFIGDSRFYATKERKIVKCDSNLNVTDPEYYAVDYLWFTRDSKETCYNGYYGGLGAWGTYLYYNLGDKLVRLNTAADTLSPETIYEYTPSRTYPSGVYLFGSYVQDGVMYFAEANYVDTTDADGNPSVSLCGTKNQEKKAISIR